MQELCGLKVVELDPLIACTNKIPAIKGSEKLSCQRETALVARAGEEAKIEDVIRGQVGDKARALAGCQCVPLLVKRPSNYPAVLRAKLRSSIQRRADTQRTCEQEMT